MIRGSCACGQIAFELTETPSMMATCHCARCRKVGASTFVFVKREHLRWVRGRELVATWRAEPPRQYDRSFCPACGAALGEVLSEGESFPVAANTLDDDPQVRNRFHEFVADKPAWYEICDDAKQFAGDPKAPS